MIRRIGVASALVVAGFVLSPPAGAMAASTVGETFDPTAAGDCSPAGRTFLQVGPAQYVVPHGGVLTSWSYQAAGSPPQLRMFAARHQTGKDYIVVGRGSLESPTANNLNTYGIQIPVETGDLIGFHLATLGQCYRSADDSYQWTEYSGGDPAPGGPYTFADVAPFVQFDISAKLEADCDHDGLGDETQDADLSACHSNAFTFVGVARNKKRGSANLKVNVPEAGDLIGSGNGAKVAAAGARISKAVTAGTAQLLIKAKGKKKRKLNETGKVKLALAVTYTPTGGKPNTQSVKVKLKKKL